MNVHGRNYLFLVAWDDQSMIIQFFQFTQVVLVTPFRYMQGSLQDF